MNHSLAELVRPHIGGVGHLLTSTSPVSSLPHGMMKLAPITTPGMPDRYLADHIYGFPVGHGWLMPACAAEAGQAASCARCTTMSWRRRVRIATRRCWRTRASPSSWR